MPRKFRKTKPLVFVFCEGETEQEYSEFLKKEFSDKVVLRYPSETGLFEVAKNKFQKDPKYRNSSEVTDEIWFFFDVEQKDIHLWEERLKIVAELRNLRKKNKIKVRLLMTTGCIEYWLLLHFEYTVPSSILTTAEKKKVEDNLKKREPTYQKGDFDSISKIAVNYKNAAKNGRRTIEALRTFGIPTIEDTDERNKWLCANCRTFSNVYEAIDYLVKL